MTDLLTHLRNYGKEFTAAQEAITMKQILEREPASDLHPTRQRRGWVIALASAVSVLVLIGGLALGLRLLTDQGADVTSDPTATTQEPTTTAGPETTTTAVPETATTAAPETTTTAAAPLDPTTAPPPYEGPVPELETGWVQEATEPGPPIVYHSDLGFVAFAQRQAGNGMDAAVALFSPNGTDWVVGEGFDAPEGDPGPRVRLGAAGPNGFVAVIDLNEGPVAFFSADGLLWEKGTPGWQGGGWAASIATGPPGHVLVGAGNDCGGRSAFSADGRAWTALELPGGCLPSAVTWTGTQYALVSVGDDGAIDQILVSSDGLVWDPVDIQKPPGKVGTWGVYLSGTGDTLVLAGNAEAAPTQLSLWYSFDRGATWLEAAINEADDAPTGEYQTWDMIHSDLGYFTVGVIETLTSSPPGFMLWSPNGAEWFQYITEDSQGFRSIGVSGDTAVASGFGTGMWRWKEP